MAMGPNSRPRLLERAIKHLTTGHVGEVRQDNRVSLSVGACALREKSNQRPTASGITRIITQATRMLHNRTPFEELVGDPEATRS
jgi:hypothetical protein